MLWIVATYLLISTISLSDIAFSLNQEQRKNCKSCNIQIQSLTKPIDLSGTWLFTRDDAPSNAEPNADLSRWTTIGTPGPWSKAYNDGQNFEIGWYRGHFHFHEDLIGERSTLYVDAYMSFAQVFIDGKQVFERTGEKTHESYRSIQPIPINFIITKNTHVITIRIKTRLMTGIYQSPFQLRPFQENDAFINFMEIFSGELRYIFAYTFAVLGLFFLSIYAKTKYPLYLVAALTGIGVFPFYAMPNDLTLRWINPETALVLHYPGLGFMALGYFLFSQFFHKYNRRASIFYSGIIVGYTAGFIYLSMNFHLDVFLVLRKSLFIVSFSIATHGLINCFYALKKNKQIAVVIFGQALFWISAGHDIFLALGLIRSTSLIFFGTLTGILSIMLITINIFGQTFIENRKLLKEVESANQSLEVKVKKRTQELRNRSNEMIAILNSLPEAVLKIDRNLNIESSFSLTAKKVLNCDAIDGKNIMDLVFLSAQMLEDEKNSIKSTLEMSIDEPNWTFESNLESLPTEISRKLNDYVQFLSLGWNTILNEDELVERIIVTVADVTAVKHHNSQSNYWQLKSTILNAVIKNEFHKFKRFTERSLSAFARHNDKTSHWDESYKKTLYRDLHTIKGNARTLKIEFLAELCHHAETTLEALKVHDTPRIEQFGLMIQEIYESLINIDELLISVSEKFQESGDYLQKEETYLSVFQEIEKDLTDQNVYDAMLKIRSMTFRSPSYLKKSIPDEYASISQELDKPNINFTVNIDKGLKLHPKFLSDLEDSLGHLIRNSIDHGIEYESERRLQGKPPEGNIEISIATDLPSNTLSIIFLDDGKGLDLSAIIKKGRLQNIDFDETDIGEVKNLIFRQSFSTAKSITALSGRGVGMSVVEDFYKQWKGKITWVESSADTETSHQFSLKFEFPLDSTAIGSQPELSLPKTA